MFRQAQVPPLTILSLVYALAMDVIHALTFSVAAAIVGTSYAGTFV